MMTDSFTNVSDTAFWIAHYRAMETKHPYPLFRDPWAAELAGTRGKKLMSELRGGKLNAWVLIMRTKVLDRFVVEGIAEHGFDTVLNLGAGLDTRAFRLPLPKNLRWFDIDQSQIVNYKRQVLGAAEPRCNYEAIIADLSSDEVRQRTIAELTQGSKRMLVITEGLLEYLPPEAVSRVARELHALPSCHTWLCNLNSEYARRRMGSWSRKLARMNAPLRFTPDAGTAFFKKDGWHETAWASLVAEAMAYGRMPIVFWPFFYMVRFMGAVWRERISRMLGVARLERTNLGSSPAAVARPSHALPVSLAKNDGLI
jgi:methyltransferase (TIGR00027 family)